MTDQTFTKENSHRDHGNEADNTSSIPDGVKNQIDVYYLNNHFEHVDTRG